MTWAPDSQSLYFSAEDGGYSNIYRIGVSGGSLLRVLEKSYNDDIKVTPGGKTLIFTRQSMSRPTEIFCADSDGRNVRPLTTLNGAALDRITMGDVETISFKGSEAADVQAWIIKPPAFVQNRKYPAVFLIHGGPQSAPGPRQAQPR